MAAKNKGGKPCSSHPYYITMASLFYRIPCAIMALATFINPATLAPFT